MIAISPGVRVRASIGGFLGIQLTSSVDVSPSVQISHRVDGCVIFVSVYSGTSGVGLRPLNPPNSLIQTCSAG